MYYSQIIATGSFVPKNIITNKDLEKKFSTSDSWIQEKIGIQERRYADEGVGVSDLAKEAALKALKKANLKAQDLDAIVFATATPDYHAPGSGVILQNKLGCKKIPAFDVRNTSPGFLYSLDLADGLIKTGRYKTILVVGAEVHSTALDFSDRGRMMSVIFGDGAGCFILQATKNRTGIIDTKLYSDGQYYNKLWCEGPSSLKNPRISADQIDNGIFHPQMDGRVVFSHAVSCMSAAAQTILENNGLNKNDIDFFLSHQANLRIIETITKQLDLPPHKVPHNIERYGNTSSASLPILIDELYDAGKIKTGTKSVLFSFGSGFCWGAGLVEF